MHQIAKINHCETSILGGKGIAVKLREVSTYLRSREATNDSSSVGTGFPVLLQALDVA